MSFRRFAVFFRFCAALLLVVMVSMAGVALEKRTLELRRAVSLQYYHTDLLVEQHVRLRLETQQLTAPSQWSAMTSGKPDDLRAGHQQSARQPFKPPGTAGPGSGKDQATLNHSAGRELSIPAPSTLRLPLLRFQQPFDPEGID